MGKSVWLYFNENHKHLRYFCKPVECQGYQALLDSQIVTHGVKLLRDDAKANNYYYHSY